MGEFLTRWLTTLVALVLFLPVLLFMYARLLISPARFWSKHYGITMIGPKPRRVGFLKFVGSL